jgi:multidrug resistance efflux pump
VIVFLTLLYCGVLFLLVRLKVIRLNTFWKISPALWFVLLLVVLFIPMQWGAPSGAVTLYRTVVEVVPNISGEVVEVPVEPLVPIAKGEVLFHIDPLPYEYTLQRLQAEREMALSDREIAMIELDKNVEAAKTGAVSESDVNVWRARFRSASAQVDSLVAQIANAQYDLDQTTVRAPSDGYVRDQGGLP